jgi:hypothetical protein
MMAEPIDPARYAARLEAGAPVIAGLASGLTDVQVRRRPAPEAWSVLEVINHLADEEMEDFRPRLDLALHRPEEEAAPIDPPGWVTARAYNERDLAASRARFLEERRRSLAWLRGLTAPDWARPYHRRAGFTIRPGDLLVAWVAHDLLHTRQLVELRYGLLRDEAAPYSIDYAGDW